jgi:anti-sigma factor RsiW
MIAEEVEFQISQYADGTLPASELKYVEDLLRSDSAAQKILAEYRRLNGHLAKLRGPDVQWDRFAQQISNEIADSDRPSVAGRIGFFQYRMRIAAAVLIACTAFIVTRHAFTPKQIAAPVVTPSVSEVSGPQAEVASGKPEQDVSISPSPALARDSRYGEDVISQGPSKVVIIGRVPSKQTDDQRLH